MLELERRCSTKPALAEAVDEVEVSEDEASLPAFVEPEPEMASPGDLDDKPRPKVARKPRFDEPEEEVFEDGDLDESTKRRKSKRKRRQLVFDEERGEVVAKRRRKGSRQRGEWDDFVE